MRIKIQLLALSLLLFPVAVDAQATTPVPLVPSNVQIIDGKKFFSLNGARRQPATEGVNKLSPDAQSVVNHPKVDFRLPPNERLAMTPVNHPKASVPLPTNMPVSKSDQVKADLLSIFSPDDKLKPAAGGMAIPPMLPATK